jgi:hypothetical protein
MVGRLQTWLREDCDTAQNESGGGLATQNKTKTWASCFSKALEFYMKTCTNELLCMKAKLAV